MRRVTKWVRLFLRWGQILSGQSYYHQLQSVGKAFKPWELAGYFNDLTGKTNWLGETDEEGIPINLLADGRKVYFATTIVQKALGHWDRWLLGEGDNHKGEFLKLCYWLLARQDENGGWVLWPELGMSTASPYSAMTQGECISAFARAWELTGDSAFARSARKALELLCKPIEQGGTAAHEGQDLFLEEVPSLPRSSILNGWIFALFGLYDYWLAFKDGEALDFFQRSLETLKKHLPRYDAGYWSYYDLQGHLASPFYHDLHINQLSTLVMVYKDPEITKLRDIWIGYRNRWKNRVRAFIVKAAQKLREPGEVVIVR